MVFIGSVFEVQMAHNLIEEAISSRRQGLREKAIELLENYCLENPGDLDMATTLRVWKKEVAAENWTMSRRDSHRSSCDQAFGRWSRLVDQWSYEFASPFTRKFLPDISSPIIANDMAIVPDSTLQSFIGLKVNNGHPLPSPKILGGRLSYASTPVYVNPYLIFALNGALYQICFGKDELSTNLLVSDPRIQLIDYCAPMVAGEIAVFGLVGWILLYKPGSGEARFLPYKLTGKDDSLLSPIQRKREAVFLSRYGQILRVAFNENELEEAELSIERIGGQPDGTLYSPPCLLQDRIYFESLSPTGLRSIGEYNLSEDRTFRMEGLEEGICSPNDTHLYFPPIAFQEGVIVSSDIESKLYYVQGSYPMRVIPINIELRKGNLRVHQTSHIFAFVLGGRLIGKIPKGFFCLDLLNPKEGVIEIFRPETEVIAQPINYNQRVFFITRVGVRCYTVK